MDLPVTPAVTGNASSFVAAAARRRRQRSGLRIAATAILLANALLVGGRVDARASPDGPLPKKQLVRLKQIGAAAEREDCATVVKLGRPLADGDELKRLPEEMQAAVYTMLIGCEVSTEEEAYPHALAATRLESIPDYVWRVRLALELDAGRLEAAVATIEAMTQGRGAALNAVPIDWMWALNRKIVETKDEKLLDRFLNALAKDSYQPDQLHTPLYAMYLDYAVLLAKKGDREGARRLIGAIKHPRILTRVVVDKDIRDLAPATLDLREAAEAQVTREKELIGLYPDELDPLVEAAIDLRYLGRPQESLDLLLSIRNRVDDPSSFSDSAERLNWYWDGVGRSYQLLGRYDEARDAYLKGAALTENGTPNVSQVINLASAQNDFGRSAEALKTLSLFDDPARKGSPFGGAQLRLARGCANSLSGNQSAFAADLAYMRAHPKDAPLALPELLLCAGDIDGAAELLAGLLDDPDTRVDVLLYLSDYDDPPPGRPTGAAERNLKQVKERPKLKAAIERAGGIRRIPLQKGES